MQRRQKEELVANLHESFKEAKAAILTNFTGLNVEQITQLRRTLKANAVEYKVVKNTLLRRAARDTALELLVEHFVGPNAIAIAYDDPVAPAKILLEFSKEQPALEIKVGIVAGSIMTPQDIKALASLPSREVLLARLAAALKTIPTRLVRTLSNPMRGFVVVLDGIRKQKEKA